MIFLNKKMTLANMPGLFIIIAALTGLTACSGQTGGAADWAGNVTEAAENTEREAQETSGAQGTGEAQASEAPIVSEGPRVISGECGEAAVWTYDTGSKLLQITGTGIVNQRIKKSEEYVSEYGMKKRYPVKEIQVGEGITALDGGPLFLNVSKAKGAEEIKLSLPDSLERIGADTFDPGQFSAQYIRHIHLPCRVCDIEGGAFWGIGDEAAPQAYSYKEDVKQIAKKYKKEIHITVDDKNPYYAVKSGVLFTRDMKTLVYYPSEKTDKVYRIPKSVTHIKALAFARNSFLKEVVLPKGLKAIGAGAFFNNHRLTKINLEQAKKLKRIRDFDGVKYKISTNCGTGVPAGIPMPEEGEEYHNPAEYRKDFYGSGRVLKEYYFLGTFAGTNLKSIQFPDRLKYVAYNTFKNCLRLKKISIGRSFAGEVNPDRLCDKKGFSLPASSMDILVSEKSKHYKVQDGILYSRDGRTVYKALRAYHGSALVLDKNVRKIAREAFSGTAAGKLQKVVVLGDLKQISREAFAVSRIKSFEVYGNVDTIGIDAFFMCYGLKRFVCHGTVKHVSAQAFYYAANLEKLSLGKNIVSIGTNAFDGCEGIKKPRVKKEGGKE